MLGNRECRTIGAGFMLLVAWLLWVFVMLGAIGDVDVSQVVGSVLSFVVMWNAKVVMT